MDINVIINKSYDSLKSYSSNILLLIIVLLLAYVIKNIYGLSYGFTFFIFLFLYGYIYTLLNQNK
jgi:hypothetical protein